MGAKDVAKRVSRFKTLNDDEELAERFTDAFSGVLEQALTDINSGRIKIEDVGDIGRMYNMWKDVTNYVDKMSANGTSGALPELSTREVKVLEESTSRQDLEEVSDQEMQDIILQTMSAKNDDNAETFMSKE